MYASTTHWRPATEAWRSDPIRGRATLTMVTSSWTTTKPKLVATMIGTSPPRPFFVFVRIGMDI